MLADVTLSDAWLRAIAGFGFIALGGATTWIRSNQKTTNEKITSSLAETAASNTQTAASVEKISAIVEGHAARLERLERWQDTDHYADVIEHRAKEHR